MFKIRMGIPEMKEFWDDLPEKKKKNALNSDEEDLFKRFAKAIANFKKGEVSEPVDMDEPEKLLD